MPISHANELSKSESKIPSNAVGWLAGASKFTTLCDSQTQGLWVTL